MVKKSVTDYIRTQLQKGYNISTIREVMLRYGYTNKDVDDAISAVYHPTIRHEIHLGKTTIFALVFIVAAVIGTISFFYFNPPKAPSKLLDLNLEPVKTEVQSGEDVVFLKELSNLGSSKRYDVIIKQEILDPKTFQVITEKTETRAIETFGSTQTRILVPQDTKPGNYILRIIVEYDDKKAIATLPIKVIEKTVEKEVKKEIEKINCDDNNPCTEDAIENDKCINKPIVPCCGNNICEENEKESCAADCPIKESIQPYTLDEIKEIAKTEPSKALQECSKVDVPDLKDTCIANIGEVQRNKVYCSKIDNTRVKDVCYSTIAKLINDNSLCSEISLESRKDSCYMTFVLDNKDYSVCNKITNKAIRQSCESLRQLYEINQQSRG